MCEKKENAFIRCYKIGERAEFSKTVSESDVYLFAGITGDMNPIHINAVAAANSFAKERIVHGALINAILLNVIGMKLPGPGTIYMEQNSKFIRPVYIGDTVTAEIKIEEIMNKEKGILKLKTSVMKQDNKVVLTGFAVVKIPEGGHV